MSTTPTDRGERYEIIISRRLGARSATAFEDFELSDVPGDGTLLRSGVIDQAALHGVLSRIRDLGIPLVSVRLVAEHGTASDPVDAPVNQPSTGPGSSGKTK